MTALLSTRQPHDLIVDDTSDDSLSNQLGFSRLLQLQIGKNTCNPYRYIIFRYSLRLFVRSTQLPKDIITLNSCTRICNPYSLSPLRLAFVIYCNALIDRTFCTPLPCLYFLPPPHSNASGTIGFHPERVCPPLSFVLRAYDCVDPCLLYIPLQSLDLGLLVCLLFHIHVRSSTCPYFCFLFFYRASRSFRFVLLLVDTNKLLLPHSL
jgi:hypothetical protein